MNFRPELAQLVLDGKKTVTRRLMSPNPGSPWYEGGCKLNVGQLYAVCPGRGKPGIGRIRVTRVEAGLLGDVDDYRAVSEGFGNVLTTEQWLLSPNARELEREGAAERFRQAFRDINGTYDPDLPVWVVGLAVEQPTLVVARTAAIAREVGARLGIPASRLCVTGTQRSDGGHLDGGAWDRIVFVRGWSRQKHSRAVGILTARAADRAPWITTETVDR